MAFIQGNPRLFTVSRSADGARECAVVGAPDERWGEAVKAVIELRPGQSTSEDELKDFCRDRLGGMKTPKSIEFWPQLPRSQIGKVLKRDVRAKFWIGHARQV